MERKKTISPVENSIKEIGSREYFDIEGVKKQLRHRSHQSSRKANKILKKNSELTVTSTAQINHLKEKKQVKINGDNSAKKNRNQLERLRKKENSIRPAPIGVENSIRTISAGLPESSRR